MVTFASFQGSGPALPILFCLHDFFFPPGNFLWHVVVSSEVEDLDLFMPRKV